MEIRLHNYTNDFLSGQSGLKIGNLIDHEIEKNPNQKIMISFYGIDSITPSFVNGALLYIIDLYGIEYFKEHIKLTQLSNNVSDIVKQSVTKHFEYKKTFFQNLKTNKFYCALNNSLLNDTIKKSFRNISDQTGAQILLNPTGENFTDLSKNEISKADCLIGIIFENENQDNIFTQANYALSQNKPCIVICSKDYYIKIDEKVKSKTQIIRYDKTNLLSTMREMNSIIMNNMTAQPLNTISTNKNDITFQEVMLWGGVAVLGGLLIKEILNPK